MLAKIASLAPRSAAYARAITLSAYDVVLSPAVAPFSLRGQGTTTPLVEGSNGFASAVMTASVGSWVSRLEPSGEMPAV